MPLVGLKEYQPILPQHIVSDFVYNIAYDITYDIAYEMYIISNTISFAMS